MARSLLVTLLVMYLGTTSCFEQVTVHIVREVTKELAGVESTPYWVELALNFAVDLEHKVTHV